MWENYNQFNSNITTHMNLKEANFSPEDQSFDTPVIRAAQNVKVGGKLLQDSIVANRRTNEQPLVSPESPKQFQIVKELNPYR